MIMIMIRHSKVLASGTKKNSARGRTGGHRAPNVNLRPHKISETTKARMLELKTQLDVVKYSLWYKNFSASGRPGGVGPPGVNFGPRNISEIKELEN